MLEKNAVLGVAKDNQGLLLVDKISKKGARMNDEMTLKLTLGIWEFCDKKDVTEIVNELTRGTTVPSEQLEILKRVVNEALNFFVQAGWATEKGKKIEKKKDTKR